jgi:hypothetical protein
MPGEVPASSEKRDQLQMSAHARGGGRSGVTGEE